MESIRSIWIPRTSYIVDALFHSKFIISWSLNVNFDYYSFAQSSLHALKAVSLKIGYKFEYWFQGELILYYNILNRDWGSLSMFFNIELFDVCSLGHVHGQIYFQMNPQIRVKYSTKVPHWHQLKWINKANETLHTAHYTMIL